MHDIAFAESTRPARCVVLGLPLSPYSIGHELILLAQGNMLLARQDQFDDLPPELQQDHLRRAVAVCCRDWRGNQTPMRWIRLWLWLIRKSDYAQEIEEFRNYRKAGSSHPPSPSRFAYESASGDSKEDGRAYGGPMMAKMYDYMARLPDREVLLHGKTAFDFPLGLAHFIYLSHLEEEGGLMIQNSKEAQVEEELTLPIEELKRRNECPA